MTINQASKIVVSYAKGAEYSVTYKQIGVSTTNARVSDETENNPTLEQDDSCNGP